MRAAFVFVCLTTVGFVGCAHDAPKRLRYDRYDSQAMHVPMEYSVYTPPGFREDERLPLVVFLHGGGDDPESFDEWNVGQALDAAIEAGRLPRMVVTLPQGDLGFWANWRDGSRWYEDWVMYELVPHVQARFHTRPCPDGCHVMGVSMGGAGTVRFALRHPDRFASAGILSAPVFDTEQMLAFAGDRMMALFIPVHRIWGEPSRTDVEQEDPYRRWTDPAQVGLRLYVAWAESDRQGIVRSSRRLHEHLDEHEVPHGHEQFAGGHNWRSWTPVIVRALAYMLDHSPSANDTSTEPVATR